ncbi:hypothetical protein H9Q16_13495 [Sulfitobacter sp. TSTF-M16]|uniref:GspL periplasmic domain-containing protein n=1 Tax=Sulfitobacter aestuariivivens TaxID=2766981 RepID=A0A927D5U6_9RHOB|nr:hypothetical protein [Sulfitobacter aestuariivivens]
MANQKGEGLGDRFVSLIESGPPPGAQQVALVPGAEVPVLSLDLPPGLRGQSREQVARRQLLDRAGLDANAEMRPIHAPKMGDAWSKVMIVDSGQLEGWKTAAGANCRALLPDYLALPTAAGLWTIARKGDTVMARLGPDDGFTAPVEVARAMLDLHLKETDNVPKAIWLQHPDVIGLVALAEEHGVAVVEDAEALKALDLPDPKVLGHGELAFDLRRDPQLARARMRKRVLPWRWPVLLGLFAIGLWAATQMVETRRLQNMTAALNAQTADLVRAHFVPSGPLLDIRIQVSQTLAERRLAATGWQSQVTALDLFATASGVLTQTGATTQTALAGADQELALSVTVADFAAVDALAAALRGAGLRVNVVESRVTEGASNVRADLRLTPPEPAEGAKQ